MKALAKPVRSKDNQREEVRIPSPAMDAWIRVREGILSQLIPTTPSDVLNQAASGCQTVALPDIAADLKHALDELKAAAMTPDGAQVDYQQLRSSPAYVAYQERCSALLQGYNPSVLRTEVAQKAFWINLYNALTLDAVIAFGIQQSVSESRLGLLSFFRRAAYIVNGMRISLDDIEHGILRANQGHPYIPGAHFASHDARLGWALPSDPRIHFALNCASRSCPPIRSYSAAQLDFQLDLAARHFIHDTVEVRPELKQVFLSQIFGWFERDFGGRERMLAFILRHLPDDPRGAFLRENREMVRVRFTPYDWGLNSA